MSPRFYAAEPLPRHGSFPQHVTLGDAVAAHVRVLRLAIGDTVTLFDGQGGEFSGVIENLGKREVTVMLAKHYAIERESPLALTLVQALATGDKMDLIVQKAVELGVTAIQPVVTMRATVKLSGERAEKKVEHWRGVAIAACEQCGRNRIPSVAPIRDFAQWLTEPFDGTRAVLHPEGGRSLTQLAASPPLALLIGPEGGFDDHELALARRHGTLLATLGTRVLRTETAGLAALAAMQVISGDLK